MKGWLKAPPIGGVAFCLLLPSTHALAQSSSPIRLAVGAPAGGSIDTYARIIADHMTATLGRPVIIEIKSGANGNIAAQWVLDGPADGSQVWVGAQSMLEINPSTYKNLRWKRSDFVPIIKGIETPLVLVAHPSVGQELRRMGRLRQGQSRQAHYANYGPGTISHFSRLLNSMSGSTSPHAGALSRQRPADDRSARRACAVRLYPAAVGGRAGARRNAARAGVERTKALAVAARCRPGGSGPRRFHRGRLVRAPDEVQAPDDVVKRFEAAAIAAHADPAVRAKLEGQGST
jgi:hypothetical protein